MPSSKKGGKQFRRSLKTKDRKPADRRSKEIKVQVGGLSLADGSALGLKAVARPRVEIVKHTQPPGTVPATPFCRPLSHRRRRHRHRHPVVQSAQEA
jgi:hypothetical protein